jgi:hypothetical protein
VYAEVDFKIENLAWTKVSITLSFWQLSDGYVTFGIVSYGLTTFGKVYVKLDFNLQHE